MLNLINIFISILIICCCVRAIYYITSWKPLPFTESLNKEKPLISILIPARNEERSIGKCLDSLLKQNYPNLEIIMIDDQSTDSTSKIISEFAKNDSRIKLIQGKPLPQGWMGKCWALYQGVQIAKGEWFLFSDADVIHNTLTLNSVYQYVVKNDVSFLTLKYKLLVKTFWEKVIPPSINFIKTWFAPSPKKVNDMNTSAIEAKGDFIFVKRGIYEKLGGHKAVKDEFIESATLMQHFKKAGHKVALLDGSRYIKVRKYSDLKDIINSYSKFFYKVFQSKMNILLSMLWMIILLSVISPIPILLFIVVLGHPGFNIETTLPILQVLVLFSIAMIFYKKDNFNPWYALAFPLGAIIFISVVYKALFELIIKRSPSWRGRIYH